MKLVLPWRSILMSLYWICAGVLVFTFGHFAERSEQQPYPGEPSREVLNADFHDATSSVGDLFIGEVRYFHRGQATGLRVTVASRSSLNESMERIDKIMSKLGWSRIIKRKNNRGSAYLKFCKQRIAAIFEANDASSEQRVHVGVVWSGDPKHYAYCTT